ncbi:MAG: hypothetical protein KME57_03875 [Scytonema hyalinum WJT4-NPBG1]|jgi:hypothetical protein|nr:hypothetical protein [Scytonema hyalinum WJT4-NPBG1]
MQVTFHGQPMRLLGLLLKVGELTSQRLRDRARNVRVIDNNLSPVLPLARSSNTS